MVFVHDFRVLIENALQELEGRCRLGIQKAVVSEEALEGSLLAFVEDGFVDDQGVCDQLQDGRGMLVLEGQMQTGVSSFVGREEDVLEEFRVFESEVLNKVLENLGGLI